MKPRMNTFAVAPALMKEMIDFSMKVQGSGLEGSLMELVKIRASQINGCAMCLHMHSLEARKQGETEERLFLLSAWRESPLFTDRERAALAWTEALTLVSQTHAPDADYAAMRAHFSEEESVKLTLLIGVINTWNRIQIGFQAVHPVAKRSEAA